MGNKHFVDENNNIKLKVLMVFSSVFDGMGICHNVFNYCKYINRDKFEIQFVMINQPTPYFEKILSETGDKYHVLSNRNKNQISYIIKLSKILKREKIDIIHAHGNSATLALEMMAGKLAGVPVRIAHSRNSGCQHQKADKILRPLFMKCYTDGFAVSKEAGEWLFKGKEYKVIKNGNDITKFSFDVNKRKEWRRELTLSDDIIAIGHVGTFNERKNQSFAVDVFKELINNSNRNYKLFFIGDGKMKKTIEEKVQNLGLGDSVVFLGLLDNMPEILQAMDIMLLTSFFEGLPNVLIEWQAACLPCIVSDTVTREANITKLPIYKSLDDGSKEWANVIDGIKLDDREKLIDDIISDIQNAGFDVKINAKNLENEYLEAYRKSRGH